MGLSKDCAGHRLRLRERFAKSGFVGFAEHEIIELFLTLCLPRKDVKSQARALLQKFGSICAIFDADVHELAEVKGIGTVAPLAFKIIKTFMEIYLGENLELNVCILDNYDQLERFWRLRLRDSKREVFEIALLNARLELLRDGVVRLEEGVVDRTNAYPRKIIECALFRHASAIIIAHNHPSGSSVPSDHDHLVTKRIEKISESLGIRFIDHIIVARHDIFSFRKEKLIKIANSTL
ncbi:MAG: DNA repair protein RadC [Puniceicoccales bacterium]|jgi:DNA repair protein RadC|nr:DNA repair protein RadC [Puniceicoccales bacterium]